MITVIHNCEMLRNENFEKKFTASSHVSFVIISFACKFVGKVLCPNKKRCWWSQIASYYSTGLINKAFINFIKINLIHKMDYFQTNLHILNIWRNSNDQFSSTTFNNFFIGCFRTWRFIRSIRFVWIQTTKIWLNKFSSISCKCLKAIANEPSNNINMSQWWKWTIQVLFLA